MTQINYEEEHRKLWNWLADHPDKRAIDYFESWKVDRIPKNRCFACEVAGQKANGVYGFRSCGFCPLGGLGVVGCKGGLFMDYVFSGSLDDRRELARIIATLSWKEKEND